MAPDEEAGQAGPPPAEGRPSEPPADVDPKKLSKTAQKVLALKKANPTFGAKRLSEEAGVSRTSVRRTLEMLVMRGFLDPSERPAEHEEESEEPSPGGMKAVITGRAVGASTAEAAKQAALMSVEFTDLWIKTGEWAWHRFNEVAKAEGYTDALAWLEDCVRYWATERAGWQTVVDDNRLLRQRIEQLEVTAEAIFNARERWLLVLEAVVEGNLSGRPLSPQQIAVLMTGRAPAIEAPVGQFVLEA